MYRVRVANIQIIKSGATGKIKTPYVDFPTSPLPNVSDLNPAPGNRLPNKLPAPPPPKTGMED